MDFCLDDEVAINATWQVIRDAVEGLDSNPPPYQIELNEFLTPPIHKKLARWFLQQQRLANNWTFLGTDQLVAIASKNDSAEIDIEHAPGVYCFVCLQNKSVLKVGQSENMRHRIAEEHLRKPTMNTNSLVSDYVNRRWSHATKPWQEWFRANETTALIFPFFHSQRIDRIIIEQSLQAILMPTMP